MRNVPTLMQLLEYGLWLLVVILAMILQVAPFVLALTLIIYTVGVTATASLIFTVCIFGLIFYACWIATQRKRTRMDIFRWGN